MSVGGPGDSISEPDWGRFQQGLRAALMSRIPLELGQSKSPSAPGGTASLGKLKQLEGALRERLARDPSLAKIEEDDSLPDRYRAALRVFEQTGDMPLVLEGLATGVRSRRQLSRLLRSTVVYLFFVIGVAYLGMLFFSNIIMPSFNNMRDDMQLVPIVDARQRADGMLLLQWTLIILPLGLLAVLIIVLLMGGSGKIASWLGGRRYQTHRASATAVRTARALISQGISTREAVSLSCTLVGNAAAVQRQVTMSLHPDAADATDSADADHLESLANHFQSSAANRMAILRVVLPIGLIAIIGGAVAMTYALSVFLPLVAMLKDLALPGR